MADMSRRSRWAGQRLGEWLPAAHLEGMPAVPPTRAHTRKERQAVNSYDLKSITDHLAAITDHVEAVANSGTSDALADVYNALDSIGDTLTQISNTLARTLDREQTRFITVTMAASGDRKLLNTHWIVSVSPEGIHVANGGVNVGVWRVRETPDELLTMINAGAYVPPF